MPLVAFEGLDGVGKTTYISAITEELKSRDISYIVTQELYGDEMRDKMRSIFMGNLDGVEELLLVSLARHWHNRVILANVTKDVILIDRFIASTIAYQVGGHGVDESLVDLMQKDVWHVPKPDMNIYIKGERYRTSKEDRFEAETSDFMSRVTQKYESLIDASWLVIDNRLDFQQNVDKIVDEITKLIYRNIVTN